MSTKKKFVKVPVWAPKQHTFAAYSNEGLRWLRNSMNSYNVAETKYGAKAMRYFEKDEDILRFCLNLNNLKKVNLSLCEGKIILKTGELYEPRNHDDIDAKIEMVQDMVSAADGMSPLKKKDIFPNGDEAGENHGLNVLKYWKIDCDFQQTSPHFIKFLQRLQKFHDKANQISFEAEAWVGYNKSLSNHRIELDEQLGKFLRFFLLREVLIGDTVEKPDEKQKAK